VIDWRESNRKTEALLRKVGLRDAPTTLVEKLGVGKQQLVEIAKALAKDVRLLILDEPTSALSESDSQALLDLMLELKAQGMTQIIISHKLNEVRRVADTVTVIRDGHSVSSFDAAGDGITEDRIVRDMVGRSMENRYPARTPKIGERIMRVADWSVYHPEHADRQVIRGVSFDVRKGEVVGIAGLMGAGRTELAMSIFGRSWGQNITGAVEMHGRPVDVSDVPSAIRAGLAYVTEDRKSLGLILDDTITRNITLANLPDVARGAISTSAPKSGSPKNTATIWASARRGFSRRS
jgi:putative multiple sugar transport system ATP-binding protein